MGREQNVAVFEDTKRIVKTNERIRAAVQNSTSKQKLILEKEVLPESKVGAAYDS